MINPRNDTVDTWKVTLICLYSLFSRNLPKAESSNGRGYSFLTVISFRPLSAIQGHSDSFFFSSKKNLAPTGEEEGRMRLADRESDVNLHSLFFWLGEIVKFSSGQQGIQEKVNGTVIRFMQGQWTGMVLTKTCFRSWYSLGTEERTMSLRGVC